MTGSLFFLSLFLSSSVVVVVVVVMVLYLQKGLWTADTRVIHVDLERGCVYLTLNMLLFELV